MLKHIYMLFALWYPDRHVLWDVGTCIYMYRKKARLVYQSISEKHFLNLKRSYDTKYYKCLDTHNANLLQFWHCKICPQYRAGFTPMLFQWSYSHMARFSLRMRCDFYSVIFFALRPLFIMRFLFCRAIFHVQTDWALLFVLQLIALLFVFPIDNTYE